MVLKAIEAILSDRIGLEPKAFAGKAIARTIRERMAACGVDEEQAYLDLIRSDGEELDELIESMVVPETWFFRDHEPFVFLKKHVAEDLLPLLVERVPRVLSLPGSTGEEPYSIVMALMDLGLRSGDFVVDAVDISRKAIRKSMEAVYSAHSFREKDEEFRRKYFIEVDRGYQLIPEVRHAVNFVHGNLLEPDALGLKGPYDIVFFRNLLIYLNERARRQAIRFIDGLLRENGILFLGYAESQRIFFPDYERVNHPRSYAARKVGKPVAGCGLPVSGRGLRSGADAAIAPDKSTPRNLQRRERGGRAPADAKLDAVVRDDANRLLPPVSGWSAPHEAGSKAFGESSGQPVEEGSGIESGSVLERARRLADQARFDEAETLCAEALRADATCADAYCLLGVIALAMGNEDRAVQYFNKVVYLSPSHRDALFHLSLLMEKRGLRDQAERFRERVRRAGEGNG